MTFPLISNSATQNTIDRCNALMDQFNQYARSDAQRFKNSWLAFWDSGMSMVDMQAQLDLLAAHTFNDASGNPTNALAVYFASALNEITDVLKSLPTAFSDAVLASPTHLNSDDTTTTLVTNQPGGTPYQKFLTPGWYYTIDGTGRMIVSAPVEWLPSN